MKKSLLMGVLICCLALPAAAFGQDAGEGYSGVAGLESGGGSGSGAPASQSPGVPASRVAGAQAGSTEGSLPFTGLEVGLVAGAGLLLLVTGLAFRRARTD